MFQFISEFGVTLRSKNFCSEAQAQAVAAKILAHPAYSWSKVIPNPHSRKRPGFIVLFQFADRRRMRALRSIEQAKRERNARKDGDAMAFSPDKVGGRAAVVCYSGSGEEYTITGAGCSCPDARKVNPHGLRCKHELAMVRGLGRWV